jgi:hypothetical protein
MLTEVVYFEGTLFAYANMCTDIIALIDFLLQIPVPFMTATIPR